MYAEVAVCLPFLQTFLYEIAGETPLPARVTVPFRSREVQGFVVGFREDKPDAYLNVIGKLMPKLMELSGPDGESIPVSGTVNHVKSSSKD